MPPPAPATADCRPGGGNRRNNRKHAISWRQLTARRRLREAQAMGAGWYVALEQEVPGVGGVLPHNGKALLFAQHHLEVITRQREVPPLKAFFSSDPNAVVAYLREQGVSSEMDELADEEWYDASVALPTLRHLLE